MLGRPPFFSTAKDAKGAKRGEEFYRMAWNMFFTASCVLKCTEGSAQYAEKRLGNGDGFRAGVLWVLG
jgi:hypothetical protein